MRTTWGPTDKLWLPIADDPAWLQRQTVVCLITQYGFLDIFTQLPGVRDPFPKVWARAFRGEVSGTAFRGLCDTDMLAC